MKSPQLPELEQFTIYASGSEKLLYAILETVHRMEGKLPIAHFSDLEFPTDTSNLESDVNTVHIDTNRDSKIATTSTVDIHMDLQKWQQAQQNIAQDPELAVLFWSANHEENGHEEAAQAFVRFIAMAAQWNQVIKLWDVLADRCKKEQRPANALELAALEDVLSIHNLIWHSRQATLESVVLPSTYNYKYMQRGISIGDTVVQQWLPMLRNAGGEMIKAALVQTN